MIQRLSNEEREARQKKKKKSLFFLFQSLCLKVSFFISLSLSSQSILTSTQIPLCLPPSHMCIFRLFMFINVYLLSDFVLFRSFSLMFSL